MIPLTAAWLLLSTGPQLPAASLVKTAPTTGEKLRELSAKPSTPKTPPAAKATSNASPQKAAKKTPQLAVDAQLANLAQRLHGHRASKADLAWLDKTAADKKRPKAQRIAAAILRAEQGFAHANIKDGEARFSKLIKAHKDLEDLLQLRLANQALKVKAWSLAESAYSAVDQRKWRGSRQRLARLGRLKALFGGGKHKQARQAQKRFRALCRTCMDGGTDDVLYIEAHLEVLVGRKPKARELLTKLVDRFPERAGGAKADLLLQEHFPGEPVTLERRLRSIRYRAGRLGDRWAVEQLRQLRKRYAKRPNLLLEVELTLGRQLRRVNPVEGVALLDRLLKQMGPKHARIDALMTARRIVLPRVGRYLETADNYFDQAWKTKSQTYRMERLFYTAWSLFGAGKYRDASEIFAWLSDQKRLDHELRERARWYAPWSQFRAAEFKPALKAFDRLATKKPAWAARATYWAGRSALAAGDVEAGMLRFQVVRERWPHTLYGLRVASLPAVKEKPPFKLSDTRRKALGPGAARTRLRLAVAGNLSDARWSRGEAIRGQTPVDPAVALQWGTALRKGSSHHAAFLVATRALRYVAGLPGQNHRALWELAYPRPWFARCDGCAEMEQIPVALVYAIMREESQFRPAVESPAEAVGLMQIIPPTAALIAARLEGRKLDPTALDDPNHNIAMGTWYLAGLSKRYDAQLPLVMAAYNAGPAAADGWIRRANSLQMDLTQFMEEVPYRETRGYVKRVSRSLAVYRMLYGLERGTFSPMVQGLVQNTISGDLTF